MPDNYSKRGVSSGKEDVHAAIKNLSTGLYPNTFCKILPDHLAGDHRYCNILHTDTAGSKPSLAYIYWRETGNIDVWKGIVQDALVMNLDDMLCSGAIGPFVVSSNIARNRNRIPANVLSAIITYASDYLSSLADFGIEAVLAGGETADVGDIVRTIDVGYTVASRMSRDRVLNINIQPGDLIVGLASDGMASYESAHNSGIGCNGLTSARHDLLHADYRNTYPESYDPDTDIDMVYSGKHHLTDHIQESGLDMGTLLLSPTRTYAPVIKTVLDNWQDRINGIIHCTGGGQTKCLHFANDIHIIKNNLFNTPHIFNYIQECLPTEWQEMYRTFNMGHRLEVYTDKATAEKIIETAASYNINAQIVGHCEAYSGKKLSILHRGETLIYN